MTGENFDVFGRRVYSPCEPCPSDSRGDVIRIACCDGARLEAEADVACMSGRLRRLVQEAAEGEEIEVLLRKEVLLKILDYCRHRRRRPQEELLPAREHESLAECGASRWELNFLSMDRKLLFEAMVAASYLEIPGLVHLFGMHVRLMVRGKSFDKIRKEFGLANDMVREEEEQLGATDPSRHPDGEDGATHKASPGAAAVLQELLAAAVRTGLPWEERPVEGATDSLLGRPKSFREASWRAAILEDWRQLEKAPADIRDSRSIVFAAVDASRGAALRHASDALRADRRLVLRGVQLDGLSLLEAAPALRGDRAFVLEAVAQNWTAALGALYDLRMDRSLFLEAARQGRGAALCGAAPDLLEDRDFILECVALDPATLRGVPAALREDRFFALSAVRVRGAALAYLDARLRADLEIVRAAVEQDAEAAAYAHTARRAELGAEMPWDSEAGLVREKAQQDLWFARRPPEAGAASAPSTPPLRLREPARGRGDLQQGTLKCQKSVQFSALSVMIPNMGQSNYIAANMFLDKLPARQRPEVEAITLMWGAVGHIGMRWKAFASQDAMNATPELLLSISEAARVLRLTTTVTDGPEWYAAMFFDEMTRKALLAPYAGGGTGGGWMPGRAAAMYPASASVQNGEAAPGAPRSATEKAKRLHPVACPEGERDRGGAPGGRRGGGFGQFSDRLRAGREGEGRRRGTSRDRGGSQKEDVEEEDGPPSRARSPLQGWPSLAGADGEALLAAPEAAREARGEAAPSEQPLHEGARVRLRGVRSKCGATGLALTKAADGRWKVRLDGGAGNALLRACFLEALPPPAPAPPRPPGQRGS